MDNTASHHAKGLVGNEQRSRGLCLDVDCSFKKRGSDIASAGFIANIVLINRFDGHILSDHLRCSN